MNQEDRTDGGRSGSRRAETRSGTRSAEGRSSTADDRSAAADDKGASAGHSTKRRTVLAAAIGLVASTGLAGCTIRADTDSIQIDFDDGDGDGAEPGAGDDDPTDGIDDDGDEDTPTAQPDGDEGGTGDDGGGGGGGDDPDDETPTASPTPTPVDLEESVISMLTVYDDVAVEFESAAAEQVSDMADAALAEGVYQDEAEYRAFVESAFYPQRTVAEEIVGVATADSTNAYEAAVVNLAEALNDDVAVHALARAQHDVTIAASDLERN